MLQFRSKVDIFETQNPICDSSSLSDFATFSTRKGDVSPIKGLNVVQLGDISCHMSGVAAVDEPRSDDIPLQLSLENVRVYLDLGT